MIIIIFRKFFCLIWFFCKLRVIVCLNFKFFSYLFYCFINIFLIIKIRNVEVIFICSIKVGIGSFYNIIIL